MATSAASLNSFSAGTKLAITYAAKHTNKRIIFLIRLVSLSQLLLLILTTHNTPRKIHSPLRPPSNMLGKSIDLDITTSILSTSGSACAILVGLIIYFILISGLIIKSYFTISKNQSQISYKAVFSTFTIFHAEVLSYIIARCLNELLRLIITDKFSEFPVPKGAAIAVISIIYILNFILTFSKLGFCYSKVQSVHFISRKTSSNLIAAAALKLLIAIFESTAHAYHDEETVRTIKIASICISFLICCGLLFNSRTVMPEYDLTLTKMHIIFESAAICMAIFTLGELLAVKSTIEYMALVMPLWVKLNMIAFRTLITKITRQPEKYSRIKYAVNLETILQELEPGLTLNAALEKFSTSALDSNWLAANNSESENIDPLKTSNQVHLQNFQKGCKTFLKDLFERLLQKDPRNTLGSLVYAQLILRHFQMYSKAYYSCLLLSAKKTSVPEKIALFSIMSELKDSLERDKTNIDGSLSQAIWQGFIAENAFGDLRSQVSTFGKQSSDFWKLLEAEKPDIQNLIKKAETLEKQRNNIEELWRKHEELFNKTFPLGYLLYALFKSQFEDLPWEGANYIDKYLLLSKSRYFRTNVNNDLNLANCVTIMISGEKSTLGNIMNCSETVFKLFGIKKDALIGRAVNVIMPRFFQDKHDNFLKRYYETGKAVIMGKESKLYAKDNKNNIFPISISLTIQPNLESGIAYTGLIKKIEDKFEYVLFTENGVVEEVSVKIRDALCIEPYQKTNIGSIFPDYIHNQEKTASSSIKEQSKILEHLSPGTTRFKRSSRQRLTIFKHPGMLYKVQDLSTLIYENKVLNVMKLKYSNAAQDETVIIEQNRKAKKQVKVIKDTEIESILSEDFSEKVQMGKVTFGGDTSNRVLLSPTSLRMTENVTTEHKFLTTEVKFDVKSEESEESSSEKNFENILELSPTVVSDERKGSSLATSSQGKNVDNFQKLYQKRNSSKIKTAATTVFILILAIGLGITIVQYAAFKQSVNDIEFSRQLMKLSYDRLSALSWIWRYSITYKARLDGIVAVNLTQLDIFKGYLQSYGEMILEANRDLAEVLSQRQSTYQELFFEKNIKLIYNETGELKSQIVDSFEAINIFLEKLGTFYATPYATLAATGNPDLNFVQRNSMGDLLIVSESLITTFGDGFVNELENKKLTMVFIFASNLAIAFILILFPIIYFFFSYQINTKLFRAILTIHPRTIKLMISKFDQVLTLVNEKGHSSPEELYNCYISNLKKNEKSIGYKLIWNPYKSKRFFMGQIKNSLILIFFIISFAAASSIGFSSSYNLLDGLLTAHSRVVSNSQAQYNCNLAYSSLIDMIESRNTTTIRNQPADQELFKNIDAVYSSSDLYNVYTDGSTGKFVDPRVEIMLMNNPCPYVYNYPGIQNTANCPKVTQNSSIGIFAVNSDYKQDLYELANEILANLTFAKSKSMFSSVTTNVSPESNTVIGAFLFLNDVLNAQLDNDITYLLNDGKAKLTIEIILMILIGTFCIWFLIKKVFDDDWTRMLLRTIPFEEASKNKLLQNVLKDLYKGKDELHHLQN